MACPVCKTSTEGKKLPALKDANPMMYRSLMNVAVIIPFFLGIVSYWGNVLAKSGGASGFGSAEVFWCPAIETSGPFSPDRDWHRTRDSEENTYGGDLSSDHHFFLRRSSARTLTRRKSSRTLRPSRLKRLTSTRRTRPTVPVLPATTAARLPAVVRRRERVPHPLPPNAAGLTQATPWMPAANAPGRDPTAICSPNTAPSAPTGWFVVRASAA